MIPLIFLSNRLLNPSLYKDEMHLPLEFITYGFIEGKMYKHYRYKDTFITINNKVLWGNRVVYGALFFCPDVNFYLQILDAYHSCSLSTLKKNHIKDLHHRHVLNITTIYFDTLEELSKLQYREGEKILAHTYIGNTNHPKIKIRLHDRSNSFRIIDGINANDFKKLYERNLND